ncbi:hypothetical protein MCOR07_002407 [Pyricularia oryzae]|nr:hypothetical protein MCOR07_002407 [Pyricularia oryzae]
MLPQVSSRTLLLIPILLHQAVTVVNAQGTSNMPPLNVTAISASGGDSTFECWQFGPFTSVTAPGVNDASALLLTTAATQVNYAMFPAGSTGGLHRSPRLQFVVFMTGRARITLPNGNGTYEINGGGRGCMIVSADTSDVSRVGHTTDYPGDTPTGVMQVPITNGRQGLGRYRVLHQGTCTEEELGGTITTPNDGGGYIDDEPSRAY